MTTPALPLKDSLSKLFPDQLTTDQGNGSVAIAYKHDADGNLIEDQKWKYTWNGENRLIAMETRDPKNTQRLEFTYDPQGRRISKTTLKPGKRKNAWKKESQTYYIYDNWNLIAELDKKGNLLRTHLWGQDLSGTLQGAGGVGGLLATKDHSTNQTHQTIYDANGNIVQYVDASTGQTTAVYDYDPFGNVTTTQATGNHNLPFQFSTKYQDGET